MEYDSKFISILYSQSVKPGDWLFETIEYLKRENILTSEELKLCNNCIENLEINGRAYLEDIVRNNVDICTYDYSEIDSAIEEFISARKNKELEDMLSSLTLENIFSKDNVNKFYKGYVDHIRSSVDTSLLDKLDDLDVIYDDDEKSDLSTACDRIDNYCYGLKRGTITTIVGDESSFKSMWAINMAYQAICDGKNVMYLTVGVNKLTVMKRLLSRHSNTESKFERPLKVTDFKLKGNINLSERVILDFQENYRHRLICSDVADLKVPSDKSLRRLVAEVHSHFSKTTGSGLDLIVIDDMTNLSFYNGKKLLTARNSVIDGYYKLLKDCSRDLFGTGYSCSVICTHKDKDNGAFATKNNGNYTLNVINEQIAFWSDTILTIYDPSSLREIKKQARVKVLKCLYGDVMDREVTIKVDYPRWFIAKDNLTFSEAKLVLNMQQDKIKDLERLNEVIIEQRDAAQELVDEYRKDENRRNPFSDNFFVGYDCSEGLGINYEEPDCLVSDSDDDRIQDKFDDEISSNNDTTDD